MGRNNYAVKIEELKAVINNGNKDQNYYWFIQFIITKRLSQTSTSTVTYFIDFIKHLNPKESIPLTLACALDLFKKCMLVDEDQFAKISQKSTGNPFKTFLIYLG